jgi:hypothetical protein
VRASKSSGSSPSDPEGESLEGEAPDWIARV